MKLEDLKKLKIELEAQRKKEFAIIEELGSKGIYDAILKNKKEIDFREDTDDVVKKCENIIEQTMRLLVEKGIDFDEIMLTTPVGIICKYEYYQKLKQSLLTLEKETPDNNTFFKLIKGLNNNNILPGIIPINIGLYCDELPEGCISKENLQSLFVNGIVKYEQFISKMTNLGYDVSFMDSIGDMKEDIKTFDSYIDAIKEDCKSELAINVRFR